MSPFLPSWIGEESTCNRGRYGAATALGPKACKAWIEAGMPQPIMPGDMGDGCARVMGMDLNFREKGRFKKVTLFKTSAHHTQRTRQQKRHKNCMINSKT